MSYITMLVVAYTLITVAIVVIGPVFFENYNHTSYAAMAILWPLLLSLAINVVFVLATFSPILWLLVIGKTIASKIRGKRNET